jgi:hypothetical protein
MSQSSGMPDESAALDAALDRLYSSDPSEFVSVRKQLASELKTVGDKAAAKELANARRPSTAAWALNQVARQHPKLVEALLTRSRDLVGEQTGSTSGDRESLRVAIRGHREAVDAATDAALAVLGARANDSFRSEIVSMLRAASTDTDAGRDLRVGRLVRDNEWSSGFPEAVTLTLVPAGPAAARPAAERKGAKRDAARELAAQDRARAAAAEHEAERLAARARHDAAQREAAGAEADATRAREVVAQLQAELTAARRQLRDAQARVRRARDEAARLSSRADDPATSAPGGSDHSRE